MYSLDSAWQDFITAVTFLPYTVSNLWYFVNWDHLCDAVVLF